jgi:hypothetical protein
MNRYNKIEKLKQDGGRRYLKTVQYPHIPRSGRDLYILGKEGDRLDNLANKYYKDSTLWWILARANNIGKGDLTVPIGKQLRIPLDFEKIVREFNNVNTQ